MDNLINPQESTQTQPLQPPMEPSQQQQQPQQQPAEQPIQPQQPINNISADNELSDPEKTYQFNRWKYIVSYILVLAIFGVGVKYLSALKTLPSKIHTETNTLTVPYVPPKKEIVSNTESQDTFEKQKTEESKLER